jgi:hypothetical protein
MAIVAVWLAAFAPTVSRITAWNLPDLGAWCEPAGDHHRDNGTQGHGDDGAACGYCTLFTHHPGLAVATWAAGVAPIAPADDIAAPPAATFVLQAAFHHRPRGPPVAAHA